MSTTVKPQPNEIPDDKQSNRKGKKGKRMCWGQAEHSVKVKSSGKRWENKVIRESKGRVKAQRLICIENIPSPQ